MNSSGLSRAAKLHSILHLETEEALHQRKKLFWPSLFIWINLHKLELLTNFHFQSQHSSPGKEFWVPKQDSWGNQTFSCWSSNKVVGRHTTICTLTKVWSFNEKTSCGLLRCTSTPMTKQGDLFAVRFWQWPVNDLFTATAAHNTDKRATEWKLQAVETYKDLQLLPRQTAIQL